MISQFSGHFLCFPNFRNVLEDYTIFKRFYVIFDFSERFFLYFNMTS